MTTTFWILATAMWLVASAFVLWPLRRGASAGAARLRRDALLQAHRAGVIDDAELAAKLAALPAEDAIAAGSPPRWIAPLFLLLTGLAAYGLYQYRGEPKALDPVWRDAAAVAANGADAGMPEAQGPTMEQAVAGLAERLRNEPDDLEGWMLLGRAYKTMERFEPAREALANAYRLAPDDANVMVEYAEAQVLASGSRRFEGAPRELLEQALQRDPQSQRGLWLLGVADYQDGRYEAAVAAWERLLAGLPPDADARNALVERIADARERAGMEPPGPAVVAADPPVAVPEPAGSTARITVEVDISPELKARVGASDVLFVFARAAEGPRMPLAIQRLPAASLPVTVTLDDSTSMMPQLKLSTVPQVVIGARVSKSGQAAPQPGDFEALSEPLPNTHSAPVRLRIGRELP